MPEQGMLRLGPSVFRNLEQGLDHGDWIEPTFINSTIIYKGEEMRLKGARFQNCQFQISMNPNGSKFFRALLISGIVSEGFN